MAYVVLILAILSRVLPVLTHGAGAGVTLMGAALIFFGAEHRGSNRWQVVVATVALAVTDWWLTVFGYGFPFHLAGSLVTWLWYAAVMLGMSFWLVKPSAVRVGIAAIAAPTSFFLLSNGMVWLRGTMYPHTGAGLLECYAAGVPFYRNDLVSTVAFTAVVFLLASVLRSGAADRSGSGIAAI